MNKQLTAAESWCRLTNALIAKYKSMSEQDPNRTIKEVHELEKYLLSYGYLDDEDLEGAL